MSSTTSYRLSSIALLIGSALWIIYWVCQAFINTTDVTALASPLAVSSSVIGLIGSVLVLLGLPGVYIRQAGRAGVLGLLGFLFQGILMLYPSVTIYPNLVAHPATRQLLATNQLLSFSFLPF